VVKEKESPASKKYLVDSERESEASNEREQQPAQQTNSVGIHINTYQ
jgi:hypothetical protein